MIMPIFSSFVFDFLAAGPRPFRTGVTVFKNGSGVSEISYCDSYVLGQVAACAVENICGKIF
jgi:hypothetical protein